MPPKVTDADEVRHMAIELEPSQSSASRAPVVFARLLIGVIVMICAEFFSGASLKLGFWHPVTLLLTYWLYFGHFFFLTTLAVRTGRTSLGALYLWGVLFGLYESWITKVIWSGYGDGKFIMGSIGPYGFSEISMVFLFHPVMSFILPLAVTCLLCPPLRALFPDLAWLTGNGKLARVVQGYLVVSFVPIIAMNSRGPVNLALNAVLVLVVMVILLRLARPALSAPDGRPIVVFGRRGFVGLCVYLAILYGLTYSHLRPEGLPSVAVQSITFVFYAAAILGLCLYRRRDSLSSTTVPVEGRELKLVVILFGLILVSGLVLSVFAGRPILFLPILPNFAVWTILGFALTAICLVTGVRERLALSADHSRDALEVQR